MSNALKEKDTLLVGITVDGKLHQDFIVRPRLVSDSVKVMEDEKAQNSETYRGVALYACQLEKLGELTPEQITTELLLTMFDADLAVIIKACTRLEVRLTKFREPAEKPTKVTSGAS